MLFRSGWAKRPTGGRAIFHSQEWTYALVARIDDSHWGGSLREAYAAIGRVLVGALVRLGVPAQLAAAEARDDAPSGTTGRGPGIAAPCFASTARHEIVLAGKKFVGSAQRRTSTALLQQGSVLLGPGHLRLVDYLRLDPATRMVERERLAAAATDAGAFIDPETPLEHWADALAPELPTGLVRFAGRRGLTLFEGPPYTPAAS